MKKLLPTIASRLYWRRYVARNALSPAELESFPALDPRAQRRALSLRLLEQVRHFGTRDDALPEWKEAARVTDPDELWRIWPSLPVTGKSTLRDRFPALEIRRRFGIEGRLGSTGGSTGEPTQFLHDWAMAKSAVAVDYYVKRRMGWRPGMAVVSIWGSERDIGRERANWKLRAMARLLREHLVDGYRLSSETVDRVLALVRSEYPVALYGFSSMLEYVAREVVARGAPVPNGAVRTAWNGGEMLFPEQVELFRKVFGVPILNRYGGRELSTMACQYEDRGPIEVLRPWLFLEVLDEAGKPVGPGECGRLVWTSTINRGTPFLRYDIGDLGVFSAARQTEAGVTALSEIQGRRAGLLTLPDGRTINALYWNHVFKEFSEIRQFQVVLRRDGTVRIALAGDGMPADREQYLRSMLSHLLGAIPVMLEWTNEIPRTAHGKLLQVLRES